MLKELEDRIQKLGKVAVCFSGGIDSSFILFVANKVLPKDKVLAIIANGEMMSRKDYDEAIKFLKENNYNFSQVSYEPLEILEFKENKKDRCYYCKKNLLEKIKKEAVKNGFKNILDGTNADDLKSYRPGNKAANELQIISLLADLNFSKKDIREYSKSLGIKFWNKPSNSCLATRFSYNTALTHNKLRKVELSEEVIQNLGIKNLRVRSHNEIARIEVEKKDFKKILENKEYIIEKLNDIGYKYITLDLSGLNSGKFDN